jgi:hypothetical protein
MPRSAEQLEAAATAAEQWLDGLDPSTTPAEDISDLRAVAEAVTAVAAADARLREAVAVARAHGRSWGHIAAVLGVSRQSARERYAEFVSH